MLKDPLFLPTAKGMVPTERARALAPSIRDIIERVGGVIASAEEFDPATTVRRFRIGAPDGAISILVPALVEKLEIEAPGIDLAVLQILPSAGAATPEEAWRGALADLNAARIDIAVLPHRPDQARFHSATLFAEEFVVVTRRGHPFAADPSIQSFAAARHVLVSASGDTWGFVDKLLAERGYERRITLTVPSFFMAVAAIASSNLIGALPRRFAIESARLYPVQIVEPPFVMLSADLHAIVSQAAMLDRGIVWLLNTITRAFS
jgi:DNA-binding transcriptional LysR family regulator